MKGKAKTGFWWAGAFFTLAFLIQLTSCIYFQHERLWLSLASLPLFAVSFGVMVYLVKSESRNLDDVMNSIKANVGAFLFQGEEDAQTDVLGLLKDHLRNSIDYIRSIGEGKFDVSYPGMTEKARSLNKGNLSGELLSMKEKMQQITEQEKLRNWAATGIARFSELVHSDMEMEPLLNKFISELVKYVGGNQGGIFIVNESDPENLFLELKACYAYERQKYMEHRIMPEEGLVGQVFVEGEPVYITEIPDNYFTITSGLGGASPKHLFIIPLKNQEKIEGVLEIASFDGWNDHEKDFLVKVGEILGSAISGIKVDENTKKLLIESQNHAKLLETQEEELRQNLEELSTTQEALERQSQEVNAMSNKFKAIIDSTVDAIITISEDGIIESVNQAGLRLFGYKEEEMIGKNVKMIIPDPHHHRHDQYLVNYKRTGDAKIIGKVRQLEAVKKDGRIIPVELAVNVADLETRRIYTGIVRDITERIEAEKKQQEFIEELRAQEEELRQNAEELQATQEEIHRQMLEMKKINGELDARIAALNISTIVSESDLYGRILFVNDKFCEVSQFSREELIGKPHNIVRHPDMPKEVFRVFWQTIKSGCVFRGIIKNKKKYGGHYWVDAVISPVLDEDGKPVKYIGVRYVIEDEETGRRLFNEQLESMGISPEII